MSAKPIKRPSHRGEDAKNEIMYVLLRPNFPPRGTLGSDTHRVSMMAALSQHAGLTSIMQQHLLYMQQCFAGSAVLLAWHHELLVLELVCLQPGCQASAARSRQH